MLLLVLGTSGHNQSSTTVSPSSNFVSASKHIHRTLQTGPKNGQFLKVHNSDVIITFNTQTRSALYQDWFLNVASLLTKSTEQYGSPFLKSFVIVYRNYKLSKMVSFYGPPGRFVRWCRSLSKVYI